MNAFTIDADNNITVHATKKAARQTGAGVFDSAENLAELIGQDNKRLVEIWNSLTGVAPVKRFTSRAIAAKRIFAEVQKLTAPAATEKQGAAEKVAAEPKPGSSKKEILLGLVSRVNGASLEELMAALGWQKHSVRGFIATLGKTVTIESFKTKHGVRTYKAADPGQDKPKG
jgi:hypothetical protein